MHALKHTGTVFRSRPCRATKRKQKGRGYGAQPADLVPPRYPSSYSPVKLPRVADGRPNYRLFEVNRIAGTAFNGQSHESCSYFKPPLIAIRGRKFFHRRLTSKTEYRGTANEPRVIINFFFNPARTALSLLHAALPPSDARPSPAHNPHHARSFLKRFTS